MKKCNTPLTVVKFIGACAIVSIISIALLAYQGKAVPDSLSNVAVGALAALGAILANTKTTPETPNGASTTTSLSTTSSQAGSAEIE